MGHYVMGKARTVYYGSGLRQSTMCLVQESSLLVEPGTIYHLFGLIKSTMGLAWNSPLQVWSGTVSLMTNR